MKRLISVTIKAFAPAFVVFGITLFSIGDGAPFVAATGLFCLTPAAIFWSGFFVGSRMWRDDTPYPAAKDGKERAPRKQVNTKTKIAREFS